MTTVNNFEAKSFLKDGEGRYVEIQVWTGRLPDDDYIEGWIALSVDGQVLLDERHWDLIDQLWAYLIDGLIKSLDSGEPFECYFPDQPLKLRIHPMRWNELVFSAGAHIARTSKQSFIEAIATGGRAFFRRMISLVPAGVVTWDTYLARCEDLLARNLSNRDNK